MNRAIVLVGCLSSAAAIAGYTLSNGDHGETTAVVTVTNRGPDAGVRAPVAPPPQRIQTPADRAAVARDLQRELRRVGCYGGEVNGVWTTSSRMAMKAFTDHVNAALPIDSPDYVLLSLVQGHRGQACGCVAGQPDGEGGICPATVAAATPVKAPPPRDPKADAAEKKVDAQPAPAGAALGSAVPTAAAAAIAAAAVMSKPGAKPKSVDEQPRPAAMPPPAQDAAPPPRDAKPERAAGPGGTAPPEGTRERRTRRTANRTDSQPPKVVRNVLRALGFRY